MTDARIICRDHGVVQNIFNIENLDFISEESHCPQCDSSDIKVEYVDHIPIIPCGENASCPLPWAIKAAKEKEIKYYRDKYFG